MRSAITRCCSAIALMAVAGLFATDAFAETPAAPSGAGTVVQEEQVKPSAKRGHLGVKVQSIDEDTAAALGLADAKGALITAVMPDGPAAAAGLKPYDAILSINGEGVDDGKDLARRISNQAADATVDLLIMRADGQQTIKVKLGSTATSAKQASAGADAAPAEGNPGPKLGLMLASSSDAEGVVIADVATDSDALRKGLMSGDRILEVDGKAVSSPSEVADSLKALQTQGRKAVLLLVRSGDKTRAVPVRFTVSG